MHKSLLLDRIDVPIGLIDFIANSIEICGNLIATEAVDKHETCYTARWYYRLYEVDIKLQQQKIEMFIEKRKSCIEMPISTIHDF